MRSKSRSVIAGRRRIAFRVTLRAATNMSQKNAKQMRNSKQNCFSHSSVSPRNDKQCSAKQCFANQTNRCLAGFASRSDLFRDNARLTKHRRKVNQWHLILQAMYTTMWLEIDCWLAVSHMFRWKLDSRIKQCLFLFFCFVVTQTRNRKCAKPFCFLILVNKKQETRNKTV